MNIQEFSEIVAETEHLVETEGLEGARSVNLTASLVSLGAWAKGRSSSVALTKVLRRGMAIQLMSWKQVVDLHSVIGTLDNAADNLHNSPLIRPLDELLQ